MRHRSTNAARFALNGVVFAAACLWGAQAWALGLGRLTVQSALGETLRAEIEITSLSPEEAASLQLRVASADAYRAAGVEYNAVLPSAVVQVVRRPDGRQVLRVTSDRAVLEPFVDVIVEANWASGRLVREYTLLFDPPGSRLAQAAAAAAAPVITPAPAPARPLPPPAPVAAAAPPAPASAAVPRPAPAPAPRPAVTQAPRPAPPPPAAPVARDVDQVRVRAGDTLTGIAGRTQRSGVSLDQMLVALFHANPRAFMGDNMNRLQAGVVLSVPSAEEAGGVVPQQAREIIAAQAVDFDAYRQRLASGATAQAGAVPARRATGRVQAQVDDSRQSAAPTPDRLTLSQGAVQASAAQARMAQAGERADASTRLSELARNVEELKRLQGGTSAAVPAAPTAPIAPAQAPEQAAAQVPDQVPAPGPGPDVVAQAPTLPAVQAPVAAPAPAPVEERPLDTLLDHPLLLPGAGLLVALLAGLGLWRLRGRMRKPAGETSFLESRLQPDSFFGASGGQRVDTREPAGAATGGSSTMSYSLSQLDAIGDVDPVAEADVYLAYGRDLQAEEILKEAMRATPERLAIRSKLLEVYAKRRDTKGFELLATQLHNLTHGQGEEWTKAQTLGLGIDPDNILYQPGGHPGEVLGASGQPVDLLAASTVTYAAPAGPPAFQPAADATLDRDMEIDLDLDLPHAPAAAPAELPHEEAAPPFTTAVQPRPEDRINAEGPEGDATSARPATQRPAPVVAPPVVAPAPASSESMGLDFDLGDFDMPGETSPARGTTPAPRPPESLDFAGFGEAPTAPGPGPGDSEPLARKLELAEEFRQIGDLEGARDLLEEVVAKADGALRSKAQGMLDTLG